MSLHTSKPAPAVLFNLPLGNAILEVRAGSHYRPQTALDTRDGNLDLIVRSGHLLRITLPVRRSIPASYMERICEVAKDCCEQFASLEQAARWFCSEGYRRPYAPWFSYRNYQPKAVAPQP